MAPSGYLAVDLFFILSGFVIAHTYDPRFEAGLTAVSFIKARAIRFWPLFASGTALGASWLLLENIVSPPAVMTTTETVWVALRSLAYIPEFTFGDLFPLNIPAWSLFFELLINALFAVFFISTKTRFLDAVIVVSAITVAALSLTGMFEVQAMGVFRATFGFALGVALYRRRQKTILLPGWVIFAVICTTFILPAHPAVELLCVFVIYPAGILLLSQQPDTNASAFFDSIGVLSFPLYALHYPILQSALGLSNHVPIPSWIIGLIAILACLVAAWVGEHWIDKPARRFVRRQAAKAVPQ